MKIETRFRIQRCENEVSRSWPLKYSISILMADCKKMRYLSNVRKCFQAIYQVQLFYNKRLLARKNKKKHDGHLPYDAMTKTHEAINSFIQYSER